MINLGALEGNFTGRRVMINDFGVGVIGARARCRDIAFRVRSLATRTMRGHARPCADLHSRLHSSARGRRMARRWNRFISRRVRREMNEIVRHYDTPAVGALIEAGICAKAQLCVA